MSELSSMHYEPRKAVETLTATMQLLLTHWYDMPESARAQLDAQRSALATQLTQASQFQRGGLIVDFLKELENAPAVVTLVYDQLKAGKNTMLMRGGLLMIQDDQVAVLAALLQSPPPPPPSADAAPSAPKVTTIDFYSVVAMPAQIQSGKLNPLVVRLSRSAPNVRLALGVNPGMSTKVSVPFPDLGQPVAVEVTLHAPGLGEKTGSFSRTMMVYSHRDSEPVIFLPEAGERLGPTSLTLTFATPLGADATMTEVVQPVEEAFRGIGKGIGAPTTVAFFTDVRFPAQVKPESVTPLWVRLTLDESAESRATSLIGVGFDDLDKPEQIQVVVSAEDFAETTGVLSRTMTVYSFADSQPVVFLFKAGVAVGDKAVTVDFYHKGRQIGSAEFMTEISLTARAEPATQKTKLTRTPAFAPFPASPPLPADVELRIMKSPDSAAFRYILHSSVPEVNRHFADMGSMPLAGADPRAYLTTQFDELSQWAASAKWQPDNPDHQRVVRDLGTMGEGFFDKLFSSQLKEAYWDLVALRDRGVIKSLLITSDEPWIPWEMVKPYDQRTGKSDDFLAAGWQLSRWLSGPGLGDRLNVTAVRAVIPELDLPFTRTERDYITGLKLQGVDIGTFLRTKDDVTGAAGLGKVQAIHVAAHGNFKSDNPDESPITLQGGEELFPRDMQGSWLAPLRQDRPILFLNACHSAQVGFSLTGLGGWANTAVREMRVSAFIGGLWEVNDDLASQIAVSFYENLRRDMTLGEAFHAARLLIRDKNPGNSTWLAYSLYGDPNMRVTWMLKNE